MGERSVNARSVVTRAELAEMQMELARQAAARRGEAASDAVRQTLIRERMTAADVPAAYRDVAPDGTCLERLESGFGYWIAGSENGTGKTTRAARMVRTWIERGHVSAAFVRCAGIKAFDKSQSRIGDEARWVSVGLLVLDDLGKEPRSEWIAARILDVVDARVSAQKPVIVTSNMTLAGYRDALVAGGVRSDTAAALYSRLNGACEALHVTGNDMRESLWAKN